MKLVIGVTGNISSGKSSVCKFFEEMGGAWIDADKIGHLVIEENKEKIKDIFGDYLSRERIREVIFNNPELKKKYEIWIHRKIRDKIKEIITHKKDSYFFVEGALIFESGFYKDFDILIHVSCSEQNIMERAVKRGINRELVEKILSHQMKDEIKRKKADFVIENNGTLKELKHKVNEVFEKIKKFIPRFVGDFTAGREVKWLRAIGYDAVFSKKKKDIENYVMEQKRYLITRKKENPFPPWRVFVLPEAKFYIRFKRIVDYFNLKENINIFSRCINCNSVLFKIEKEKVKNKVPYYTYKTQEEFYLCEKCDKIYWKGTHYKFFVNRLKEILK